MSGRINQTLIAGLAKVQPFGVDTRRLVGDGQPFQIRFARAPEIAIGGKFGRAEHQLPRCIGSHQPDIGAQASEQPHNAVFAFFTFQGQHFATIPVFGFAAMFRPDHGGF